jgi:hypothetical protein
MCRAAKNRRIVRLADGRSGRLFYWPGSKRTRGGGRRAKIMLPSGAYIVVDLTAVLEVMEDEDAGETMDMPGVRSDRDRRALGPDPDPVLGVPQGEGEGRP